MLRSPSPSRSISTHAPRTGSDQRKSVKTHRWRIFQPTLPARGATAYSLWEQGKTIPFQPTLPARGATTCDLPILQSNHISTHAPRTGSDTVMYLEDRESYISTHAPRTGSDSNFLVLVVGVNYFNPRSPHGERQATMMGSVARQKFQPTLPARGATISTTSVSCTSKHFNPRSPHGERQIRQIDCRTPIGISTHAPRTGSDTRT